MTEGRQCVLVLWDASEEQRRIIRETLEDVADVVFAAGCQDQERRHHLESADVILSAPSFSRMVPREEYPLLKGIRLIQLISAGVNQMDFSELPNAVRVAGNAGAFAEPMAEHVVAMVLALAKQLVIQDRKLRLGEFDHDSLSRRVAGMTALIIGFGGIGRATARLMRAFDVRIEAINHSGTSSEPADFVGTLKDLDEALQRADVVVLSLPLTNETRGLIGSAQLAAMKPDAILVNVGRGELTDEQALYEHAKTHPEFMVGLDVWWDEPFRDGRLRTQYPLMELPNVIGSPHNSGNVRGIMDHAAGQAAQNVRRFLLGEDVVGLVRREDYDLALHPGMVVGGSIAAHVAEDFPSV